MYSSSISDVFNWFLVWTYINPCSDRVRTHILFEWTSYVNKLISRYWSVSMPPENIREAKVF